LFPEDWNVVDYVSFGRVIDGDRGVHYPKAADLRRHGYCLFLNAGNVTREGFRFDDCQFISAAKDGQLNKGKLTRGDVVLTTRGTVGNLAYFSDEVRYNNLRINSGMVILRSISSSVANDYQFYALRSRSVESQIERLSFGSAQPRLTVKRISTLKILLPPTRAEQKAIAEALSDAHGAVDSLERLIAKKRRIKEGAMHELLTGNKRLLGFSGEWQSRAFGDIALPRQERIDPRRTEVQEFCIELEHIEPATGRLLGHSIAGPASSLKSVFKKDDVLFGKLRAYLRKQWLAQRDGVCSTEIWVLVAHGRLVTPRFLYQVVKTDRFVEIASSAYGTHMPRSDWNVVKAYQVRLPSIQEQTAITSILDDMDSEIAALQSKLAKARQLEEGMAQELLPGRIRLV
jgi:type I restriction enzyme S subunit